MVFVKYGAFSSYYSYVCTVIVIENNNKLCYTDGLHEIRCKNV